MRLNGPVTGREYPFPSGSTLVSVTDPKGRITYCNRAFTEVSGFPIEELMGQPHNLIRHPDMPAEAFRDMWATLQSGHPWTGVVKNRRRDGDHYWVQANATPMRDGGRTVGYLSVRTEVTREQVRAAEQLYSIMRAEAEAGHLLHRLAGGVVQRRNLQGRLRTALHRPPEQWAVLLPLCTAVAALVGVQWLPSAIGWLPASALALLTAMHVRQALIRPLGRLADDARALSSGDLLHVVQVGAPGLMGTTQGALRQLAINMRAVGLDTREALESMSGVVADLTHGNQDLADRTALQASRVQQTAASMEQVAGNAAQSAEAALRGSELARDTAAVTLRSNEAVEAVSRSMAEIRESSGRITDIIEVVESVAFQTNLLALNAAVEAARAGETGRGFAVVASEVRSLAQRTSQSAREIRQLIRASGEKVAMGDAHVLEAQQRMLQAVSSVERVATTLAEITQSVQEQRGGIGQINEAVLSLDSFTQQNAGMVGNLALSAREMSSRVRVICESTRIARLRPGDRTVADQDAVALRAAARAAPHESDDPVDHCRMT